MCLTDAGSMTPPPRPLTHYDSPDRNDISRLSVEKQTAAWIKLQHPTVSLTRQIIHLMTVGGKVDFQDAALSLTCLLSEAKVLLLTMDFTNGVVKWNQGHV